MRCIVFTRGSCVSAQPLQEYGIISYQVGAGARYTLDITIGKLALTNSLGKPPASNSQFLGQSCKSPVTIDHWDTAMLMQRAYPPISQSQLADGRNRNPPL